MWINEKVLAFLIDKVKNDRTPSSPKTNEELAVEMKKRTGIDKDKEYLAGIINEEKHQIQQHPSIEIPTAVRILYLTQTRIHPRFIPRVFPYGRMVLENGTIQLYALNRSREEPELERENVSKERLEEMGEMSDSNPVPWNKKEVRKLFNKLQFPGESDMSLKDICTLLSKNSRRRTPVQYRDKAIQYLSYDFNHLEELTLDMKAYLLYKLKIPVHKTVLNCFFEYATFQLNENLELIRFENEKSEFGDLDPAFPNLIIHRNTLFEDFYKKRKVDESIEQLADRFIYMLDYTGKKDYVISKFESVKKHSTSPNEPLKELNGKHNADDKDSSPGTSTSQPQIPSTSQDDIVTETNPEVLPPDNSEVNVSDVKDSNISSDKSPVLPDGQTASPTSSRISRGESLKKPGARDVDSGRYPRKIFVKNVANEEQEAQNLDALPTNSSHAACSPSSEQSLTNIRSPVRSFPSPNQNDSGSPVPSTPQAKCEAIDDQSKEGF